MKPQINKAIASRYSALAQSACCLSCGGAIDYAEASPGEVCLDLGSGRGYDVLRLADEVGKDGYAYGVDIAEGMLEKARGEAAKLGIENVAFLACPFHAIPLPDASIDLVISNCAINHAPDKWEVWREIHRLLKPGGRFAISDIFAVSEVPAHFASDPEAVAACWGGAIPKADYLEAIRAAGFSDARLLEESAPYAKGEIEVVSFTIAGNKAGVSKSTSCC